MIHRGLVLISLVCSGLVLASFGMFALDQLSGASKNQQNQIASGVPTQPGVAPKSQNHPQPRRFIDEAAGRLTSPFRSVVQSNNDWVMHAVPLFFALLVYGMGLGYLARYSRGMS